MVKELRVEVTFMERLKNYSGKMPQNNKSETASRSFEYYKPSKYY